MSQLDVEGWGRNEQHDTMNEIIHILSIKGNHSTATREEFIAGMQARSAEVELMPSRLGDFDVVKVNKQAVARAFKSQGAMLQYMYERK